MGGFRTVFGGFVAIFAGILAVVTGLVSPSFVGVPSSHYLLGYYFTRWTEVIGYMSTYSLFAYCWLAGIIIWIISSILLTIGAIIGFWKGGYSVLIGAILFLTFDIFVNVMAIYNGLPVYASGGIVHSISVVIFIAGLFGGILQASAARD